MAYSNYHSHCHYCDGAAPPEAYVRAAIAQGLDSYGFSSHAPLPYSLNWPMSDDNLVPYRQEVADLRATYANQIAICCGLEIDYIPNVTGPGHPRWQVLDLDYTIGSVHFVDFFSDGRPWEIDGHHPEFLRGLDAIFEGNTQRAVERYYALIRQMVRESPPDMVGHLDKIKIQSEGGQLFDERAAWYQTAVEQTLEVIAHQPLMIEVNTRGLYQRKTTELYPSEWILRRIRALNIPIVLNSDAHHPREVNALFSAVASRLYELGFREVQQLRKNQWQAVPLKMLLEAS